MLYHITYQIQIGAYRVQTLVSCAIHRSVEQLSDTARIVLPGTLHNAAIEVEDKIHVGDMVTISLGYSETGVQTEFKGYLKSIQTDGPDIILECEDEMWMMRQTSLNDEQLRSITLKQLLQKITTGRAVNVNCDFEFTYKDFVFSHATAYDVLKKIQDDTKADIYFEDNTLHLHPVYSKKGDKVIYDMAVNVCAAELKYVKAGDKNIKVVVRYSKADGKEDTIEVGVDGGQKIERIVNGATTNDLKRIAENEYNLYCYDGYEGSLTGWLVPYCQPTDIAEIRDREYPQKNGSYYVVATDLELSSSGGRRKVVLGRKMSV